MRYLNKIKTKIVQLLRDMFYPESCERAIGYLGQELGPVFSVDISLDEFNQLSQTIFDGDRRRTSELLLMVFGLRVPEKWLK